MSMEPNVAISGHCWALPKQSIQTYILSSMQDDSASDLECVFLYDRPLLEDMGSGLRDSGLTLAISGLLDPDCQANVVQVCGKVLC